MDPAAWNLHTQFLEPTNISQGVRAGVGEGFVFRVEKNSRFWVKQFILEDAASLFLTPRVYSTATHSSRLFLIVLLSREIS